MAAKAKSAVPLRGQKLTLGFGLVSVPVAMKPLHETARPVPGKGMCPKHGPTLSQQTVCCRGTDHEHVLESGEAVKGYPHPDDPTTFVEVEEDVLKALEEEKTGSAAIERMVDVDAIDPAYFDKTYLVWPQPEGEMQFDLLATLLQAEGKAAVVTAVLRRQTQMIVFRWSEELGCVLAHVVKFEQQVRHADVEIVRDYAGKRAAVDEKMLGMAKTLLADLEGEFDASEAQDTFTPLMQDAIRAAAEGKAYVAEKVEAPVAPVVDLMAALAASVEGAKPKPKRKAAPRKKAAA